MSYTKLENGKRVLSEDFHDEIIIVCRDLDDKYSTTPQVGLRQAAFNVVFKQFFRELHFVENKLNHLEIDFSSERYSPELLIGKMLLKNNKTNMSKKWDIHIKATGHSDDDMLESLMYIEQGVSKNNFLSDILEDVMKSIREIY